MRVVLERGAGGMKKARRKVAEAADLFGSDYQGVMFPESAAWLGFGAKESVIDVEKFKKAREKAGIVGQMKLEGVAE